MDTLYLSYKLEMELWEFSCNWIFLLSVSNNSKMDENDETWCMILWIRFQEIIETWKFCDCKWLTQLMRGKFTILFSNLPKVFLSGKMKIPLPNRILKNCLRDLGNVIETIHLSMYTNQRLLTFTNDIRISPSKVSFNLIYYSSYFS